MDEKRAPVELREGIRRGILASIRKDVELRGGRTARLLVLSGVVGVLGALGVTLMIARHPFGHHPPWHVTVVSTVWAGILVVVSATAFLQVRTPTLALSRAGIIGMLGLGLAGLCGAACPDPHFLTWWSNTAVGSWILETAGPAVDASCFGLIATFFFGTLSTCLAPVERERHDGGAMVAAAALVILLLPGVALQSVGTSTWIFAGWLTGTAVGAYAGVACGSLVRSAFSSRKIDASRPDLH